MKDELLAKGDYHLKRNTDTEIIMHSLAYELQAEDQEPDWVGVFGRISERFDGAYNIVLITAYGELVVVRDPLGIPAALHRRAWPAFRCRQRERAAGQPWLPQHPFPRAGNPRRRRARRNPHRAVRSLASPVALLLRNGSTSPTSPAPWTIARSTLSRSALGKELARLEDVPLDADTIVVPVPDTAKAAADAMAFALGVPSVEGLMRNRYVGRTFIEGTADRAAKARLKYTPLPEVLAGKRVLLVEDSIVRSTTMRALVHEIRDRGGAREIHLRVACPPIIAPCYYGIDMSRKSELFATPFIDRLAEGVSIAAQARMAKELGADSLRYLPVEAIARSVSLSPERLCRACITGHYPTETGQLLYQIENGGSSEQVRREWPPSVRVRRFGKLPARVHRAGSIHASPRLYRNVYRAW